MNNKPLEASRGAAAQRVTVKPTGCGFDPHSRRWNIYLNLYLHFFALVSRQSAVLSSATQHTMPPEFGRKWGTECLNTRFPLPTLLCAGYSMKLIFFKYSKLRTTISQLTNLACAMYFYCKVFCFWMLFYLYSITSKLKCRYYITTLDKNKLFH